MRSAISHISREIKSDENRSDILISLFFNIRSKNITITSIELIIDADVNYYAISAYTSYIFSFTDLLKGFNIYLQPP